jgi:hypothetical protein
MASVAFLQGRHKILDRTLDWVSGAAIKHILMKSSYAPTVDDDGITTASEISGVSGYTGGFAGAGRKATGTRAINRDAANDRIELDAADLGSPAWATLGTGDTIGGVLTAQEVTNDGLSLIVVYDDTNNVPTNGGNVDYAINAEGLVWM